jgi:predicted RNA-binding protein
MLPIVTLSDDVLDGEKEIELQITNPSTTFVNIISDRATGTILDATEVTADLGVANQIFDESGDLIYEVTLSKFNQSGSSIMFDLVDTNFGSASKGVDYVEIPEDAMISIPNGQSTGTYSVALIDDLQIENDETIELQISNPSLVGISISNPRVMGTITDNDVASLQVSTEELEVSESGPAATFTVVLDAQPATTVVVSLLVEDASEIATDVSRLIFTPENWNIPQMVVVNGLGDELADGDVVSSIAVSIEDSLSDYSFRSLESHMVSVTNLDNEVLSIDDFDINGITYFPNPVKEVLFLESKIAFENLSIYNILGQEIYNLDGEIKRIDMSKFQAGVYFLKINIEDTTRTIRITKE